MVEEYLRNLKKKIDYKERKEYESKNPLWEEFHSLWDEILDMSLTLDEAFKKTFILALKFLKSAKNDDETKEIIIGFENLKNIIEVAFREEAFVLYEDKIEGNILADFDSRIFEYKHGTEIDKLQTKLEQYVKNI